MADYKDKDDALYDISDSGHGYENRQEIYYNDNVGGRAVFVDLVDTGIDQRIVQGGAFVGHGRSSSSGGRLTVIAQ